MSSDPSVNPPGPPNPTKPSDSTAAETAGRHSYIVGPTYDWLLFLLPPSVALFLGWAISDTAFADDGIEFFGYETTTSNLLIGIFIHAHLFAVFFRSHGNQEIFRRYPLRFVWIPIGLWVAMNLSLWVLVSVSVLVTFWDVYHSALQTFGFARIYDRRAGNAWDVGRRLDWWLNQLLYVGPILGGATLMSHVEDFNEFEAVGSAFFTAIPGQVEAQSALLSQLVIGGSAIFLVFYLFAQWRLHRQGMVISIQKVFLLASTGVVSIYAWGFNSFGEAFFIMNFFHALQYFGIVWAYEKGNLARLFGLTRSLSDRPLVLVLFLAFPLLYGIWVEALDSDIHVLWSITLIVSILHFWYDGFIWSVRERQV